MIGDTIGSVTMTASVAGLRYRCNLGMWVLAALMVLPFAAITLLGPAFIAVSDVFAG